MYRHAGAVVDLCFAPDGETILSHGIDDTVGFWDLRSGQELLRLGDPEDHIVAMALHPRGESLVLGVEQNGRYGLQIRRFRFALMQTPKGALSPASGARCSGPAWRLTAH